MSIIWHLDKTVNPSIGDAYFDTSLKEGYIWDGSKWAVLSQGVDKWNPKHYAPTEEQLEQYPSLKNAWEHYMVTRKLLGL